MTDTKIHVSGAPQGPREFNQALLDVHTRIEQTLRQSDPVFADVMTHLLQGSGKNIRASLLLAAALSEEGLVDDDAVTAAAALEILHLATLVHDDIIDDAQTRRGQPSLQHRFGKKTAVIGGDYLFSICFSMVASMSHLYPDRISLFARAISDLCIGELNQYKHNRDADLHVYRYLRIIAGKTAALFSLAMAAGAVLAGKDDPTCRLMGRIGFQIGMLFQLVDDCLDYEASQITAGKTVKHDLAEGVVTLPLIYAMQLSPSLRSLIARDIMTPADVASGVAEVLRVGGHTHARQVADRYYRKATRLLARLNDPARQQQIQLLLDKIASRQH